MYYSSCQDLIQQLSLHISILGREREVKPQTGCKLSQLLTKLYVRGIRKKSFHTNQQNIKIKQRK